MIVLKSGRKVLLDGQRVLKNSGIVVLPTDTAYALGVDATNFSAVRKLYRLKGRSFRKPVHVIVASLAQAKKIAEFDRRAEKVFKKFLPGALTLVLPYISPPQAWGVRQLAEGRGRTTARALRLLTAGTGRIGIRMPKNKIALELARKLGRPITATSANVSGQPATYNISEIKKQFNHRRLKPDLILDAGSLPRVRPSTVLDLTEKRARILRQGPISLKDINLILSS